MCGIIAGVSCSLGPDSCCERDDELKRKRVSALLKRIRHRGPDEEGIHVDRSFWMGHARLSIVGPGHGVQPIISKSPSKTPSYAVVNGEVYNHLSLREELGIPPNVITTESDSEIILHGYQKLGADIVDKLVGMFAFVLVANGGDDILVARDKVGIKPLYMGKSRDGSEFLFSSELKGITDQCDPKEMMLFPAGHYWTRRLGFVKYYMPEWDSKSYYDQMLHSQLYSTGEDCKAALEKAVQIRCMADVEVGLFLSGGLDSSIIAAILSRPNTRRKLTATHGKIKSFAVGQEGSPDIVAARAVASFFGFDHHEALFTPEDAFSVLEEVVYHMETYEPELIRSSIPNHFLAKLASKHVKVVLTGEGSDELWSGYLYYASCKNPKQLQEENRRILKAVEYVNLQRADRMTMMSSLEARVPFFDAEYIAVAMRVNPIEKLSGDGANGRCEKHFLRRLYEQELPKEVLWRTKAMQCEGVGLTWVEMLQKHISENLVSDEDFAAADVKFSQNTPQSKEEFYYRSIFEKYYPNCEKFVHVWPGGCRAGGAAWDNDKYTRRGLVDPSLLKKGHGLSSMIAN